VAYKNEINLFCPCNKQKEFKIIFQILIIVSKEKNVKEKKDTRQKKSCFIYLKISPKKRWQVTEVFI